MYRCIRQKNTLKQHHFKTTIFYVARYALVRGAAICYKTRPFCVTYLLQSNWAVDFKIDSLCYHSQRHLKM